MVPAFILTRAFAISALFVGGFQNAHAAPVPVPGVPALAAVPSPARYPAPRSLIDTVLIFATRVRHAASATYSAQVASPGSLSEFVFFPQDAHLAKRSGRQQGHLDASSSDAYRKLAGRADPHMEQEDRGAEELVMEDVTTELATLSPTQLSEAPDAHRRSCRQPGCLRDDVEPEPEPEPDASSPDPAPSAPAADALEATGADLGLSATKVTQGRSCRQPSCLRDVDSSDGADDAR
ncbi:hypothetical protein BD414DRAFT_538926 [Trametes punicea]|nr:hypothetical protein BD414DRAFT_538926 [Trametes punicea]